MFHVLSQLGSLLWFWYMKIIVKNDLASHYLSFIGVLNCLGQMILVAYHKVLELDFWTLSPWLTSYNRVRLSDSHAVSVLPRSFLLGLGQGFCESQLSLCYFATTLEVSSGSLPIWKIRFGPNFQGDVLGSVICHNFFPCVALSHYHNIWICFTLYLLTFVPSNIFTSSVTVVLGSICW